MKNIYNKPPLEIQQQLKHIKKSYNILCEDDEFALKYLQHHNYYRLRGYWLYFEQKHQKVSLQRWGDTVEKSWIKPLVSELA